MALTFQQGTTLVMIYGGDRYEMLVTSATANQTFMEASQNVKTIHSPNLVERTFVTEKNTANLSFSVYVGTSGVEEAIMTWFGFDKVGNDHIIDPTYNTLRTADMYIDAGNTIYKLGGCIGENISFKLARGELLQLDITASAPDLEEVASIPATGQLFIQDTRNFYNAPFTVAGISNIISASCELTRDVRWLKQKTVHDFGTIYRVTTPILDKLSISGSITQNKSDNSNDYIASKIIDLQYGDTFRIYLTACNTTDRWNMGTIHQKVTDYKMLPTASLSYIKF